MFKISKQEFLEFIDEYKNSVEFTRFKSLNLNPEFYFQEDLKRHYGLIKYIYDIDSNSDILEVNSDFFSSKSPLYDINMHLSVIEQGLNKEVDCRNFKYLSGYSSFYMWDTTLNNILLKFSNISQIRSLNVSNSRLIYDNGKEMLSYFDLEPLLNKSEYFENNNVLNINRFFIFLLDWSSLKTIEYLQILCKNKDLIIKKPLIIIDLSDYSIQYLKEDGSFISLIKQLIEMNTEKFRIVLTSYNEDKDSKFLEELKYNKIYLPFYRFNFDDSYFFEGIDLETFNTLLDDSKMIKY